MISLEAPVLAGSRPRAQQLLVDLPDDFSNAIVTLHCESLIAASASFADEIVREILVKRGAEQLIVKGATDREFIDYLQERANFHDVASRLQVAS